MIEQRLESNSMFKISPAVRISFGLVMFTLSVILIADLLGVLPKQDLIMMDARKKTCEVLAVQMSYAASRSDFEVARTSLELFVSRNDDVIAASMSKLDGSVIAEYGKFVEFDNASQNNKSQQNMVTVPIYSGAEKWGAVNVEFNSLYSSSIIPGFTNSILSLLLFLTLSCFFGFMFILRKSLTVLNPKAVMPDRVRTAFNTLAEGVMILDDKERIIMANNSFASKINQNADELLGVSVSSLKWKHVNKKLQKEKDSMPWKYAVRDGVKQMGIALNLATKGTGVRTLSTNCAPIQDEKGKIRGALVTLDDITDVEETNVKLENAVTTLKNNEAEIKQKNNQLQVLATRDPLTGCYNRRAYFDLSEIVLEKAEKSGAPVSIIMADIDHFKSFNDRFGHSVGDEAIRLVSDVFNNHCGVEGAVVGRYGGEEFCITLPNTDTVIAISVAENMRQIIQKTSKGFCAENVVVTASFGVSCGSGADSSCTVLLEQADQALYVAKESGRNRVVSWNQDETVDSVNDAKVINLSDRLPTSENIVQSHDEANVALLQQRVKEMEVEIQSLQDNNSPDDKDSSKYVDPITKLPSRVILEDRISQAMEFSKRTDKLMSVVVLDIDMFSRVNATMGKVVGNEFLRTVGHRLKDILRRSDTVASMMSPGQAGPSFSRLHNDEFALLLTGIQDVESLTHIIKRIQSKFSGKIEVSGNEIYVSTCIGMSVFPQDGNTPEDLITNARRAQKQAKKLTGRNNFQLYSLDYNRKIIDQLQIEVELHNAIELGQLELVYQPKMNLGTGAINCMEALVRWNHPVKGMIFPDMFIPVAEKTGLIIEMGRWCLHAVCTQTKQWVDMGAHNIRIAVNVSAHEFSDENFKKNIIQALKEAQLDAAHLEIELTESTIMASPEAAHRIIEDLRYLGVTVSLDDFGTGFSSLSYFGRMEIDWLKLDRSFLLEAMAHARSSIMYASIVRMAHETGVKVVSEGVETEEQLEYIKSLNVDQLQGYILSKPVNVAEITSLLFPAQYERTIEIEQHDNSAAQE